MPPARVMALLKRHSLGDAGVDGFEKFEGGVFDGAGIDEDEGAGVEVAAVGILDERGGLSVSK